MGSFYGYLKFGVRLEAPAFGTRPLSERIAWDNSKMLIYFHKQLQA